MLQVQYGHRVYKADILSIVGEILEVKINEKDSREHIPLGAQVILSYQGRTWETHIVRRNINHYSLLLPLSNDLQLGDKREFPRYKKEMSGFVSGPIHTGISTSLMHTHLIKLIDVSAKGFGFITSSKFDLGSEYDLFSQDNELNIRANIIIRNRQEAKVGGYRYGAEVTYIHPSHQGKLRKFCLYQQLLEGKVLQIR